MSTHSITLTVTSEEMAEYAKGLTPQQETVLWDEVCRILKREMLWVAVEEVGNNYTLIESDTAATVAALEAVSEAAAAVADARHAADAATVALREATLAAAVAGRGHRDALDAYAAALAACK